MAIERAVRSESGGSETPTKYWPSRLRGTFRAQLQPSSQREVTGWDMVRARVKAKYCEGKSTVRSHLRPSLYMTSPATGRPFNEPSPSTPAWFA